MWKAALLVALASCKDAKQAPGHQQPPPSVMLDAAPADGHVLSQAEIDADAAHRREIEATVAKVEAQRALDEAKEAKLAKERSSAGAVVARHEADQQEIVDALDALIKAGSVSDAIITSDEDDLMVMTPPGHCGMKLLRDLRTILVSMKLDPKKAFATMQCNGGPMLKLR